MSSSQEDVERYRQQNRQTDRRERQQEQQQQDDEVHGRRRNHQGDRQHSASSISSPSVKNEKIASEREQRMARLRQELKNEDENLAALDQKQAGGRGEKGGDNTLSSSQNKQQQDGDESSQLNPQESIIEVNQEELEGLDEEEQMRKLMGFDGFGSTKGESVEDNQSTAARGGAAKNKARKYRQYMNRKSGFNRPLEKMN